MLSSVLVIGLGLMGSNLALKLNGVGNGFGRSSRRKEIQRNRKKGIQKSYVKQRST